MGTCGSRDKNAIPENLSEEEKVIQSTEQAFHLSKISFKKFKEAIKKYSHR